MKTFVKYFFLLVCFAIGVGFAIEAIHSFVYPSYFRSSADVVIPGMLAALFLLGAYLLFRWNPSAKGKEHIRVEPRLPKVKMWRESFVAGATNTGNVTATVGNKLVLNWHGTPTQRDGVLKMFPVIRDKLMPDVGLASFADVTIANIHDEGMLPDNERSNIQSLAMLWRVFTTRLDDDDGTYGDLVAHANMHATFELHEQPNDQFKVTWKISVMRGRTQ